jgi:hypothetical protein
VADARTTAERHEGEGQHRRRRALEPRRVEPAGLREDGRVPYLVRRPSMPLVPQRRFPILLVGPHGRVYQSQPRVHRLRLHLNGVNNAQVSELIRLE